MRLLTIPGTSDRAGRCEVCGARVVCNRHAGVTDCPDCTMPYDNLTGRPARELLLRELGHEGGPIVFVLPA